MHKQQVQLSKEQEHETVSGIHCMWSKGERSAQTLGLLGVILGVTILMLGQSTTDANCQSWHTDIRVQAD